MPITIDEQQVHSVEPSHQGTEIPLTQEQTTTPLYHKFVSTNPMLSDTQWEPPRREQAVADIPFGPRLRPRILIGEGGSERGFMPNDGVILDLEGVPNGVFGFINDQWVDEDQTDTWEDNTGQEALKAVRWSFCLKRARLTDGPHQLRVKQQNEEEKAEQAKANMYDVMAEMPKMIAAAFEQATRNMAQQGEHSADPQQMLASVDMNTLMEALQAKHLAEHGEELDTEELKQQMDDQVDHTKIVKPILDEEGEEVEEDTVAEDGPEPSTDADFDETDDVSATPGTDPVHEFIEEHSTK